MILHFTRQELLYGDGLAIGLIGSSLAFSQIGYFFSKEFVGSLTSRGAGVRKAGFLMSGALWHNCCFCGSSLCCVARS